MTEHEERAEAIRLLNSEGGSTLIPSALLSRLIVESQQRDALLDALRNARGRLEAAKIAHHVEAGDCWFSCPLAKSDYGDGSACCNDEAVARGKCTCGADSHNAAIDAALEEAKT